MLYFCSTKHIPCRAATTSLALTCLAAPGRAKIVTSVKRMLNRVLAEAFAGWRQHALERIQEQQIVAQVAQLPVRTLTRQTWMAWWGAYQHQLKMRSTVQRLLHGTAARVLRYWQVSFHAQRATTCYKA